MEITHEGDDCRPAIDARALLALERIVTESGKSLTQIAAAMGFSESRLRQLMAGDHWSAEGIAGLAKATDQDPIEMLVAELPVSTILSVLEVVKARMTANA